ncbi:hypothetical protein EJ06DRAFT_506611 [Trichodelitschia bisporula]|uniref:Tc1-like transposase DDE domain-containing protein n=1 Tax=Trichodelitschia bisporula TaxID=703511 RepID=A0A6G1I4L7_9PEZI|nr:hypothetical protein EJ06DRAFT_506611 [Trichodelitschia bisporula]
MYRNTVARCPTPENDAASSGKHKSAAQKQGAIAAIQFKRATGEPFIKSDIYRYFRLNRTTGERILRKFEQQESANQLHDQSTPERDPRGRKPKLTKADIARMEAVLEHSFGEERLTWENLGAAAGINDVSSRTIRNHMEDLDYLKCIACSKTWVSHRIRQLRVDFARTMLFLRPRPSDWHFVLFSDEVHFALGPQRKLRIIPRPGERECADCTQDFSELKKGEKRLHAWVIIGIDFKHMVFYDAPRNSNGKMTQKVYMQHFLPVAEEAIQKLRSERGYNYVLEEDGDASHVGHASTKWKETHGLQTYSNPLKSPDLAPIEHCFQPMRHYFSSRPQSNHDMCKTTIWEAFQSVNFALINRWIESMPARLQEVVDRQGNITGG